MPPDTRAVDLVSKIAGELEANLALLSAMQKHMDPLIPVEEVELAASALRGYVETERQLA